MDHARPDSSVTPSVCITMKVFGVEVVNLPRAHVTTEARGATVLIVKGALYIF